MASSFYDEVYVRNLKNTEAKSEHLLLAETVSGTKLVSVESLKNLFYSSQIFETLDKMKVSSFNEGDICFTCGYHREDDYGGALYRIIYAPTIVEDKGFIVSLSNSNTLRAKMIIIDNQVNVHQFGAYGDGVHDDTKAIQNAINTGMTVNFSSGKTYKVSSPLKINNSNQVLNMNNCVIATYNCYAFELKSSDESYIQNILFSNCVIDCLNDGFGFNLSTNTKNIKIENVNIVNVGSNNRVININGCQSLNVKDVEIKGTDYTGKAIYISSFEDEGSLTYVFDNIRVFNMNTFLYYSLNNDNVELSFTNCKFKNDYIEDDNQSLVFNIMGTLSSFYLTDFKSVNARKFMYVSSSMDGNIYLENLYVYNNESIFDMNCIPGTISLLGKHTYTGSVKDTKYIVFENIYGTLINHCHLDIEDRIYQMFKNDIVKSGTLVSYNHPCIIGEVTVNSELSTTLEVDSIMNISYDWVGPLLLKNINGLEGQVVEVRSTSGQEISSGGNIVLYPKTPDKSFKEAMTDTSYTFRCTEGKWIRTR